eukprot:snap_masked-scaffold214_size254108-processed-gene-0.10 protein:Tk01535 transcript:snap_masked-scaffold214_size254108-processed-gene-0.10-mRNA-1 annotation:"hypothetical protein"
MELMNGLNMIGSQQESTLKIVSQQLAFAHMTLAHAIPTEAGRPESGGWPARTAALTASGCQGCRQQLNSLRSRGRTRSSE